MTEEALNLFTLYFNPTDYPGKYVVRRFEIDTPTADVYIHETLADARQPLIERGLYRLGRDDRDDPCIVEIWV